MRIAVCDDQFTERRQLCAMLEGYFARLSMRVGLDLFPNADAFLKSFQQAKYQMVFLDIYMPGSSGIEAARLIRETDRAAALIFTTCSPDHALESYAFYAAGYLLKPYTEGQLTEVLDWCMKHPAAELQTLTITSQHEKITVPVHEIIFLEISGRACTVHAEGRAYTTNRSLSDLEEALPDNFLRCHRSFLVNMDHVVRLNAADFFMADGSFVPVSAETASRVKQSFFDYMFRKTWERR